MNRKHSSSGAMWRKHWLPWISIGFCVCVFLALVGLLYYSWHTAAPTLFRAELNTTSMVFVLGDWQESAGLFTSDEDRVDIQFQSSCTVESGGKPLATLNSCLTMDGVRLQAMTLPKGMQLYLDTEPTKGTCGERKGTLLRYVLQPSAGADIPGLTVAVFGNSKLLSSKTISPPAIKTDVEELSIAPTDGGDLEFSVCFYKAPGSEQQIPITGVSFNFRNHSAITGQGNRVALLSAGQTSHEEKGEQPKEPSHIADSGLSLSGLNNVTIEQLALDMSNDTLKVTIAGEAKSIRVPDGSSQIELVPNELSKWASDSSVTVVVTAIGALGAALSALFYAIKEFAVIWEEKEKAGHTDAGKK